MNKIIDDLEFNMMRQLALSSRERQQPSNTQRAIQSLVDTAAGRALARTQIPHTSPVSKFTPVPSNSFMFAQPPLTNPGVSLSGWEQNPYLGQQIGFTGADNPYPDFLDDFDIINRNAAVVYSSINVSETRGLDQRTDIVSMLRALAEYLRTIGFKVDTMQGPPFIYVHLNNGMELENLHSAILSCIGRWLAPLSGTNYTIEWPREFRTLNRPISVPIGLMIHGALDYEVRSIIPFDEENPIATYKEALNAHRFETSTPGRKPVYLFIGLPCLNGYDLQLNKPLNPNDFATFPLAQLMSRIVYWALANRTRSMEVISPDIARDEDGLTRFSVNHLLEFKLSTKRSGTVVFPRTEIWSLDIYFYEQSADEPPMIQLSCGRLYASLLRSLGNGQKDWTNRICAEVKRALDTFISPNRDW